MNTTTEFIPDSRKYRSCCRCHVKTFCIVVGIVEIAAILLLIVTGAISRLCSIYQPTSSDQAAQILLNATSSASNATAAIGCLLPAIACRSSTAWLGIEIALIVSTMVMIYGCRYNRWIAMIPYFVFHLALILILTIALILLIIDRFNAGTFVITMAGIGAGFAVLIAIDIYVLINHAYCIEFVKRTSDTGISVEIPRQISAPVPPPAAPIPPQPAPSPKENRPAMLRQLPPLRNARFLRPRGVADDNVDAPPPAIVNSNESRPRTT